MKLEQFDFVKSSGYKIAFSCFPGHCVLSGSEEASVTKGVNFAPKNDWKKKQNLIKVDTWSRLLAYYQIGLWIRSPTCHLYWQRTMKEVFHKGEKNTKQLRMTY